eukprot:m.90445 g.90445  ORF g.90445 m.90445 type:complete len:1140 (-) comp13267_c1_seq1:899-4318(-)
MPQDVEIVPRSVAGPLVPENRGAIAWGRQGAIGYGFNSSVAIVDPNSAQLIQVFSFGHEAPVTRVAFQGSTGLPGIKIVSGDNSGRLFIWDVVGGVLVGELVDIKVKHQNKPVVGLEWHTPHELGKKNAGYILCLHMGSPISVWDAQTRQLIWTLTMQETLTGMCLDPFKPNRICVVSEDSLIVINDFSWEKVPKESRSKYNVTSGTQPPKPQPKPSVAQSPSLWAVFSGNTPDHLFLAFPREILIMDLVINQTIATIVLERGGSPFQAVLPCSRSDILYCLHRNGCLSARVKLGASNHFEHLGQSEAVRLAKSSRVMGTARDPMDEGTVCLITSDGRTLVYRYGNFTCTPEEALPRRQHAFKKSRQFMLTRVITGSSVPLCIQSTPEIKYKDSSDIQTNDLWLGVGTADGFLEVYDMRTFSLQAQHTVSSGTAVKGVEWVGLHQIVCFTSEESGSAIPVYTNKIVLVDVRNGDVKKFRTKTNDPSQLQEFKVSKLQQYAMIIFADQPLELWDIRSCTLLKTMSSTFPSIAGLSWSLSGFGKSSIPPRNSASSDFVPFPGLEGRQTKKTNVKEHFVIATQEGHIFHFTVEGSMVRRGNRIPAEPVMAAMTCLAWKGDWIVTGDTAGNLHYWDIKARVSRSVVTGHGAVKDIVFSPGRETMFISLFAEGVAIWDAVSTQEISSRKDFGNVQVTGTAWVKSSPVLAMSDGSLRIFDASLRYTSSPIKSYSFYEGLKILNALEQRVSLYVKVLLQHEGLAGTEKFLANTVHVDEDFKQAAAYTLSAIPEPARKELIEAKTVADRCLCLSQLFGDDFELKFWTIFTHYLSMNKEMHELGKDLFKRKGSTNPTLLDVRQQAGIAPSYEGGGDTKSDAKINPSGFLQSKDERLPSCFGLLCDAEELRNQQLDKLQAHKHRKLDASDIHKTTERQVLLGQHSEAVQLLLETDAKDEAFYLDSLRACVIAALQMPSSCQNTIKLVAMNLIAAGKLDEGVELLCLVGCHLDACYYLQSEGQWERAALLAKATLPYAACNEVLSRWVDNLSSSDAKVQAVLVCLTFGRWESALNLMQELPCPNLTVLFAEACFQHDVISKEYKETWTGQGYEFALARGMAWALEAAQNKQLARFYEKKIEARRIQDPND